MGWWLITILICVWCAIVCARLAATVSTTAHRAAPLAHLSTTTTTNAYSHAPMVNTLTISSTCALNAAPLANSAHRRQCLRAQAA
jgi:hypothetical protein